jgi:DNA polymerase V
VDVVPDTEIQAGLFDRVNRSTNDAIMKTMDKANKAFGKDMIRFACQGYEKKWKLRAAHVSPSYTTNINQLLTIQI